MSASAVALIMMAILGSRATAQDSGTSITAVVSSVLAVPLVPGWLPIRSMFKKIGSCSTLDQILGPALLISLISVVIDAGLIFGVWGFFDRIKSRGLGADNILHVDR
ncbi:MAG TPA: hypothetical protein VIH78_08955 [Terriglobales bacterium]